ncbi:major facilitator superfamily domain-containing protein [Dichotomocladium elegans]|nr:major facilitator superfamily domain-containing protein [Dichotomocladium elegans]
MELAYGTPYLLSLDLSKDMTALVWLAGPLSGLVIQPVIGALSDRCTSPLGRRRPFILVGGVCVCLSMLCVAYAKELGAWVITRRLSGRAIIPEDREQRAAVIIAILGFYILDFSLNAVQASCRALILDIPPLCQQQQANAWAARLSNGAMVVGYFTGFVDLVRVLSFLGDTQIKVFCLVAILVFILTVGITCIATSEMVLTVDERDEDTPKHWYGTLTYIWAILKTLPAPIQRLCNVQFFAWLGWFPFLFYRQDMDRRTTWVSDIYFRTHPKQAPDSWTKGTRAGSLALLLHAIVSVLSGVVLPWLAERRPCWHRIWTIKNIYTGGTLFFSLLMLATIFVTAVRDATTIVAAAGISWSIVLWIPFALVGEYINTLGANTPRQLPTPTSQQSEFQEEALSAGMVLGVHNIFIVLPQFAVAIIASLIFRVVSWIEHGKYKDDDGSSVNVAWVLAFGGVMGLIATVLSLRIIEVPSKPRDGRVIRTTTGRMSI